MIHFETGHPIEANQKVVDAKRIRLVDDDNRCLMEIAIDGNGGVELSGVDFHKIDGVVHSSQLVIKPVASNCIRVKTEKYE